MKKCFIFLFALTPLVAYAQRGAKVNMEEVQAGVTAAMAENFDACNREDIRATMDSCSLEMPDRDKFERETLTVFKEKDIYYRLLGCEVLEVKFPYALAKISQQTILEDRSAGDEGQKMFRNSSALVPDEYVEYLNTFKYENGKWRLLVIVSEMRPFNPKDRLSAENTGDRANGSSDRDNGPLGRPGGRTSEAISH